MTLTVSSPITGAAQTGLSSPTYSVVADSSVPTNVKAWVVSALGGTQTGVRTHTQSDPFSLQMYKPSLFKRYVQGLVNTFSSQPKNVYGIVVRKGVLNTVGATVYDEAIARLTISIPAGSESADAANIAALMSVLGGVFWQQSAGFGDTVRTGIM